MSAAHGGAVHAHAVPFLLLPRPDGGDEAHHRALGEDERTLRHVLHGLPGLAAASADCGGVHPEVPRRERHGGGRPGAGRQRASLQGHHRGDGDGDAEADPAGGCHHAKPDGIVLLAGHAVPGGADGCGTEAGAEDAVGPGTGHRDCHERAGERRPALDVGLCVQPLWRPLLEGDLPVSAGALSGHGRHVHECHHGLADAGRQSADCARPGHAVHLAGHPGYVRL